MFLSKKHTVFVKNYNVYIEVKHGANLYKALKEKNLIPKSLCDGSGQCGNCKVRVEGKNIQKPTKHEKHVLSGISLDDGIRLACKYSVKADITVDSDIAKGFEDPDIISVNVGGVDEAELKHDNTITETNDNVENFEFDPEDEEDISIPEIEVPEQPEVAIDETIIANDELSDDESPDDETEQLSIEDKKEEIANIYGYEEASDEMEYSTDGLLLVQTPAGVQYYHYSAALDRIASEGFIKTPELLKNIIEQDQISDFVYQHIKLSDIERVIIILDEHIFEGENLFNLISYASFNLGPLLCEVIQPKNNPTDILRFLRFLNQTNGKKLLIPLDMMEKAYFFDNGAVTSLDATESKPMFELKSVPLDGLNPIVSVFDDLSDVKIKDDYYAPDSLSFGALFQAVAQLFQMKIVDNNLRIKDRSALSDFAPLEVLLKVTNKDGQNIFNVDRKHGAEIFITQDILDAVQRLRIFTRASILFAEKTFGQLDNIIFYTLTKCPDLARDMETLGMIPQGYIDKLRTFSGDPTLFAVNFFKDNDVVSYMSKRIDMKSKYELFENNEFKELYQKTEAKLTMQA